MVQAKEYTAPSNDLPGSPAASATAEEPPPINSKQYWNLRFRGDWQSKQGREQTAFFAHVALTASPAWLFDDIRTRQLSVCDWGCAIGDAVVELSRAFNGNSITGYDIANVAIAEGRRFFPGIKLIAGDLLQTRKRFDVIFSSNTLEHFRDPTKILEKLANHADEYIWLIIPFLDPGGIDEHFARFDHDNIPLQIEDKFILSYFNDVDVFVVRNTLAWPSGDPSVRSSAQSSPDRFERLRSYHHRRIEKLMFPPSPELSVRRFAEHDLRLRAALERERALTARTLNLEGVVEVHSTESARLSGELIELQAALQERSDGVAFLKGELALAQTRAIEFETKLLERSDGVAFLKGELALAQTRAIEFETKLLERSTEAARLNGELGLARNHATELEGCFRAFD